MIKYFIDKYYSGQIIIKGDNDQKSLRELTKKIVGLG